MSAPNPMKGYQSLPQMPPINVQHQNGSAAAPPSPNLGQQKYMPHPMGGQHAMSGYAMALSPRHDRVDYSMAKGGFRLWIVLFVFFMLVSGMITIFSSKREVIEVDLDGNGEMDDLDHQHDNDQEHLHSETKYEREKRDKSTPTRDHDRIKPQKEETSKKGGKSEQDDDDDDQNDHAGHPDHPGHTHGNHHHHHDGEEQQHYFSHPDPDTVGPEPPILALKELKEPLKKAIKRSVGKLVEPEKNPEEKENDEKESDKKEKEKDNEGTPLEPKPDEETLLGRLWEKMKKTVEAQQNRRDAEDEKETEKETPKKRRRRGGAGAIEKESKTEEEEVKQEEAPAEVEDERPKKRRGAGKKEEKPKEPQLEPAHEEPEESEEPETPEESPKDKEEDDVPEPSAPPTQDRPKVRVIRSKGKPKEESSSQPRTSREEPEEPEEPEAISDPEPEPETTKEEPAKPKIPVRVIRIKGKAKEDQQQDTTSSPSKAQSDQKQEQEQDKEEPSKDPPKPRIPVRYFRTKGKTPDEILQAYAERIRGRETPIDEDEDDDDEETQKQEEKEKKKIPVRVYRTKGKSKEQDSDVDADSGERSGGKTTALRLPEYRKKLITNRDDYKIRQVLDETDRLVDERKLDEALSAFEKLLKAHPRSPRAHYGKARTLEQLSAEKQSNSHYLDACIREYEATLRLAHVPEALQFVITDRLADRARFRGWLDKAELAQSRLVDKYPNDLELLNDLGATYLMMGRHEDAKKIFDNVLSKDPENGFALVHYGFILKTVDENYTHAVDYMQRGIEANDDERTQDGRFYFHLGDALQRLNRTDEAYEIYEQAAELGIFLSKYQRSLYNVDGLTAQTFWTPEQTPYVKHLRAIETEWKTIRDEGLALMDKKSASYKDDDEEEPIYGSVKEFVLYSKGRLVDANCAKAPRTCEIVARFPDAITCSRGEIKFQLLDAQTRVWPHCGPTNCRLRAQLGLVVPPDAHIRVGEDAKIWRQGKFLIIDDSFENEIWHDGEKGFRLVLSMDFWHPELNAQQRASLTPV